MAPHQAGTPRESCTASKPDRMASDLWLGAQIRPGGEQRVDRVRMMPAISASASRRLIHHLSASRGKNSPGSSVSASADFRAHNSPSNGVRHRPVLAATDVVPLTSKAHEAVTSCRPGSGGRSGCADTVMNRKCYESVMKEEPAQVSLFDGYSNRTIRQVRGQHAVSRRRTRPHGGPGRPGA